MADFGMKRNASGYVDKTAYMGMTAGACPGEIWTHGKSGDFMLIIANNDYVITCIKLRDKCHDDTIPVVCKGQRYVNPFKLSYTYPDMLVSYIKTMPEEEFKAVKQGVSKALGIGGAADAERIRKQAQRLRELEDEWKKQKVEMQAREIAFAVMSEKSAETEKELDRVKVYEEMYHNIINELIERGAANAG